MQFFEVQLENKIGRARASSLLIVGKCVRAVASMFSSVHCLSSSATSLSWKSRTQCHQARASAWGFSHPEPSPEAQGFAPGLPHHYVEWLDKIRKGNSPV